MNKLKCSVKNCERPSFVDKHQLCRAHLQKYYRDGDPGTEKIRSKRRFKSYKDMQKDCKELKLKEGK